MRGPASGERDAFRRLLVSPEVELGPARADLVEAARHREAAGQHTALRTMTEAMQHHRVDPGAFARFGGRVFIGIGGLSHQMWQAQAAGLAKAFPV